MDIDIIRKIKIPHLKASFETLALKHKFVIVLCLLSFSTTLMPHEAYGSQAKSQRSDTQPLLVFNLSDTGYQDYIDGISQVLTQQYRQQQLELQAMRQKKLTEEVQAYLENQGSPLANYASTLVTVRNWKKILALANAESSLCRNYPVNKANCWGVGGAKLWDFGSNLGDGVIAMNHFLNNYPLSSHIKYSQMTFARMNGLYKQPPAQHWVDNAQTVYNDLTNIEQNL